MGTVWKILLGVVAVVAALLAANTVSVNNQTKTAETTLAGGQILELSGGDIQVVDQRTPSVRPKRPKQPRPLNTRTPIVLLHCYACSLHWWDRMTPILAERHRVIRIDLLGFGGSDKPAAGYGIGEQAALVAEALNKLKVEAAVVVGHSMGGAVATALAEESSQLVDRLVVVDTAPDSSFGDLPFIARLGYTPVLGPAIWRVTPNFAVRDAFESAFAPDFDMESGFRNPDQVVEDYKAMTYTSYDTAPDALDEYTDRLALPQRITRTAIPLLAIFGAKDQIDDAARALKAYDTVPAAVTARIPGAGHSPNVEKPERTANLIGEFAAGAGGLEEHPPGKRQQPGR